jgi:hypothetical protein
MAQTSSTNEIFAPAISQIKDDVGFFGPTSFQQYLEDNNLEKKKTADLISVDYYGRLATELKRNHTMVFRLGSPDGQKTTDFALVKVKGNLKDFFLCDDKIFTNRDKEKIYIPDTSMKKVFPFMIIGELTESSFVNLGLASGLIGASLKLDDPDASIIPATSQSTYTFQFQAHPLVNKEFQHNKGQVQIDSVFIERRQGVDTLFIIEAKSGTTANSLAKHKLVYPILALFNKIPQKMPIVPVYIKARKDDRGVYFDIAECHYPDPREVRPTLSDLEVINHSRYYMPIPFS